MARRHIAAAPICCAAESGGVVGGGDIEELVVGGFPALPNYILLTLAFGKGSLWLL